MVISISTLDDLKKKTNESNKKALKKKQRGNKTEIHHRQSHPTVIKKAIGVIAFAHIKAKLI